MSELFISLSALNWYQSQLFDISAIVYFCCESLVWVYLVKCLSGSWWKIAWVDLIGKILVSERRIAWAVNSVRAVVAVDRRLGVENIRRDFISSDTSEQYP